MRKKKKNYLYIFSIVIAVFIVILSVGYAFFSESLTINGVASTVDYYAGEKLPTSPIVLDTSNNRYYTASGTYFRVDFSSESWTDDTYSLTFEKKLGMLVEEHTLDYTISFANPTVLPYTEGTVTTEITQNDGGMLLDASTTIDKTTLNPGEAVTITMRFHTNITWRHHVEQAKATVSYMLQGQRKYFYFILTYTT
ncbi:MAG TPA: hypothetical protein IAB68_00740 [Candidatus Aphodocola excrementigallinarum]|uniref:Uncharacterized protein n=1 Tax=Candidatus Aphodocola excrementigallinarum TaxID=2840670 RepID=A0A9D1IPK7_9FIRM|nr:hypothetical protein [Candidatus Aphodocola excrementigallinarum]